MPVEVVEVLVEVDVDAVDGVAAVVVGVNGAGDGLGVATGGRSGDGAGRLSRGRAQRSARPPARAS